MFKKKYLGLAIAVTLAAGSAQAALETSVTLKNETAYMIKDGIRTGEATTTTDTTGKGKGIYKFENTAKIFVNDEMDNGGSWHGEFNIIRDTEAVDSFKHEDDLTPLDFLRELYVDTKAGDWDLRIGKQQVVWGTADGIKLLDMINPTDWSEFNQNAPADARIPVWMINAEKYLDNGANIQAIFSQAEPNRIAGLDGAAGTYSRSGAYSDAAQDNSRLTGVSSDHPFIMKGVDTITGGVNGFVNIAVAFGGIADTFSALGGGQLTAFTAATVADFATNDNTRGAVNGFKGACNGAQSPLGNAGVYGDGTNTGSSCLDALAQMTNKRSTNAIDKQTVQAGGASAEWSTANPNSAFEYVAGTPFATFDSFVNLKTKYEKDHPELLDGNLAFRFRDSTNSGINYSFNYAYAYDANPSVNLSWQGSDGSALTAKVGDASAKAGAYSGTNVVTLHEADGDQRCSGDGVAGAKKANGDAGAEEGCYLVFTEKMNRSHYVGGSFDMAIDTASNPVVIRGEALYQKDAYQPVIDKGEMNISNMTSALKSLPADILKLVVGADTTIATDMMVSGQVIQFRNLDYIDENSSRNSSFKRYTGDMATLHLTNGLQKAEENKEFYSIFLSKPFGDSGEGRWNNIFIYEEKGGKWNRFDVEYGFNDQVIGTFEVNKYFGDENTMFGQFANSSNVQLGVKYLLQ